MDRATAYTPRGADKVAQYGWLKSKEPGKLMYVHKDTLRIDPTYQRAHNEGKRKRIASNLNWAAFGVLLVARRPDGSMWVIDGQHRLLAARSRSDVDEVPVVVFDFGGNVMEEAKDFLTANKDRQPLKGIDSFKAMVVSGDPIALQVQELVQASGKTIAENAANGTSIRCVKALCSCMETNASALRRIWPLLVEIAADNVIDQRFLWGMHTLETRLVDRDGEERSLTEANNREKLSKAGYTALMRAIGDAAAYYNRGGQMIFARGILNILNHGRQKRLKLRGDAETSGE